MEMIFIQATTANAFAPSFLLEPISSNRKKYCKKSRFCHWNGKNCTDMCGCGEFCQNADPPLPRTALEEDLQFQEGPC